MRHITEGAAPGARTGIERRTIASLAHATAHEVVALREAQQRLDDCISLDEFRAVLFDMVRQRQDKVALMADEVIGHA